MADDKILNNDNVVVSGNLEVSGDITASGGINGLDLNNGISGSNFNITGVNQLTINDPGEGIVFSGTTNLSLAVTDDASDNILNLTGTNAVLQVGGNKVATESWVSSQSYITAASSYSLTGDVLVTTGSLAFRGDANMGFVPYPGGGQFRSDLSSHTGYIKIALPDAVDTGDDMLSFWVDIYDYSTNEMVSVFVGGYNYTTTSTGNYWVSPTAMVLAKQTAKDYTVRFGYDGTRKYVTIGDSTTTWSHPSIVVRDFQASFRGNITQYREDFVISISSDTLTGIDETVSDNFPQAQNSDKLDGQDGSYYLNYNNFTNTPTLGTAAAAATSDFASSSHNHNSEYLALSGGILTGSLVLRGQDDNHDGQDRSGYWGYDGKVALALEPAGNDGSVAILFPSQGNKPSDFAYIVYDEDYGEAGVTAGENSVLIIGSENDGLNSSDHVRVKSRFVVEADMSSSDPTYAMQVKSGNVTTDLFSVKRDGNVYIGTANLTATKVGNWDTAYGWGNHGSAGYLTTVAFSDLTSKPTTLSGYGIIDGVSLGTDNIFTGNNEFEGDLLRTNQRINNNQEYPLGHYTPGETVFELDPTWSNRELRQYFANDNVSWDQVANAPGGYAVYIDGSVSVGGAYSSGFPFIPIDQDATYYMECWIKNAGTAQGHYMGSIDYEADFTYPSSGSGNPGSYGYWVMSNYTSAAEWTKVSGYITGHHNNTAGYFETDATYWTPQALFNYSAGTGTRACWISGWKVIRVDHVGDRIFQDKVTFKDEINFDVSAGVTNSHAKIVYGQSPSPDGSLNGLGQVANYGADGYGLLLHVGYGESDNGGIKITDDGVMVWGASDENVFTVIDEDGRNERFRIDNSGNATISGNLTTNGYITNTGGAKINVQNQQDGGTGRGIYMWDDTDTNWVIYMAQAGDGKAADGGSAVGGIDGTTQHAIRFRVNDNGNQSGFIWENSNDEALMQVTGDTGDVYARSAIYPSNQTTDFVSSTRIQNWQTAYGWGNHGSAGYLTALPTHDHDDLYHKLDFGTITGAHQTDAKSGTWTGGAGTSWGNYKPGDDSSAGSYYNDGTGYAQYNIPSGYTTAYIGQLKWSSGGYFDVYAVDSNGNLVLRGRYMSLQSIENSNHNGNHDYQQIIKISGLDGFSAIRIQNRTGRLHLQGIGWTKEEDTDSTADALSHWDLIYGKPSTFAPSSHSHSAATTSAAGFMSSTDKSKLDGIASGAEVNVQSDWNATTGDSFIQNKPTTFPPSSHNHNGLYYTEEEVELALARINGWEAGYGSGTASNIRWDFGEEALRLKNDIDTSIGAVYKAVWMEAGETKRWTVMIKGSQVTTNGMYIRLYQHDGNLPDGKTHVSNDAQGTFVQEDDRSDTGWYENGAISNSWTVFEREYKAPVAGYVSLVVLNWTGNGTEPLFIKTPDIQTVYAKVDSGSIGITELAVSDGTSGQVLTTNGSGTLSFSTVSSGSTYTAGSGLDLSGGAFSVEADLRDGISHIGRDSNNYITFDSTNGRIDFYAGGNFVARMESDGDLHIKGDVIAFSTLFA